MISNVAKEDPPSLTAIIPMARQLKSVDKLRLIRILAEDLETSEDIAPFDAGSVYHLATAYNIQGAARTLSDAMSSADDSDMI